MPETSEKILAQINCKVSSLDSLNEFGNNGITKVGEGTPLFNRIDEVKMLEEINAQQEAAKAKLAEKVEKKVEGVQIGIEDFQKVSLTVAEILECEKVPKSDKLYKLSLDDGNGKRQVVSGIAKWYAESDLVGKKVIIVANLKPVKLRGVVTV